MLAGQFALTTAAIFSGAAIYVSLCEQPARLQLDDRALLTEWKPSYKHGAAMQAPLALISAWPYTLLVIKPTNDELLAIDPTNAGPRVRMLIEKWGRLHAGRTAIGVLTMILFLWASLRP